ncbi:MAG: SPOR domain-containing protein, partial [Pseudomonadota bacterium]
DKALALDMVGDQAAAQSGYARVIEASPRDDPARRRLAVSYAISGNIAAFESTLRPLIERRDFAAFRARAFGLAILGEQDRAAAITEAVMPRALAAKITPYLEFMPRLTPAQQAAAANFGIFPRAADIGRDTVAIAGYRYTGDPLASAATGISESAAADEFGNQLEPAGEPFGRAAQTGAVPTMLEPAAQTVRETPKVADAFSDMAGDAATPRAPPTDQGAVDLTSFEAPIELEKPAEPEEEPPPPAHPSRVWVQLATGRDLEALGFDWRRFTRKAPEALADFTAHTVPWGQANRLLAGPLQNDAAARDLVNTLQKKGLDTFRYTSPEGQEIQPLKTP